MKEKIAVQCNTQKEWESVRLKAGLELSYPLPKEEDAVSITIGGSYSGGWCSVEYNESIGYKTISAADYLKEGEVEEFKVGDEVECVDESDRTIVQKGVIYTITEIFDNGKIEISGFTNRSHEAMDYRWGLERFKLAGSATKPKTTKENNMNINSSIRTVFVEEGGADFALVEKLQANFGAEIDENFTGLINLRINKELYTDEIKRLDDIETKRLKEEAKK